MKMRKKYLLVVVLIVLGLMAAVNAETVTFEQDQGYPAVGAPDENIIGVDGWTSNSTTTTAFTVNSGPTPRPTAAGPASQMGRINESFWFKRVFSETNDVSRGTVSFILYAGNAGNDNYCFWVFLKDSTPSGSDDIAMQLLFAKDDTQTNATGYFQLKNGTGGLVAQSPDIAEITHNTWYKVEIEYNLADMTGGSNGTYDLTITNLSLATPAVVWSHTDETVAEAVSEVDCFLLGPVVIGGTKTMLDDITFTSPPPVDVNGEIVTFEQDQGYPPLSAANKSIIGIDGWQSSTSSTTAFIVDGGPTPRPEAAGFPSQMGRINENAHFWRDFNEPNDVAGSVSFILYAGNAGNNNHCFWVLLKDSTLNGSDDVALQLFFTKDDTWVNATGYFTLKNGVGGTVATSPDINEITHSTWYKVEIEYDLADMTGGVNGTYDLTITNLSLATPAVVWSHTDEAIGNAVSKIDRFYLGGGNVGGTKTRIDDILFAPLPPDCQDVIDGGYGIASDLNEDCYVNLQDLAIFVGNWPMCNDPNDINCEETW